MSRISRKTLISFLSCVIIFTSFFGFSNVYASDKMTFTLDATYGQTEAREMLELINDFRTDPEAAWQYNTANQKVYFDDLQPLEYNYHLEKVAMQRAAEIAINYEHDRPNKESLGSMIKSLGPTYIGENIAIGQYTKEWVFDAWKEENELYDGQGHRRNMLYKDFKYVGIGHAVVDGAHLWVQVFGGSNVGIIAPTTANDSLTKVDVEVDKEYILGIEADLKSSYSSTPKFDVGEGKYVDVPDIYKYADLKYVFKNCKIRLGGADKLINPKITYEFIDPEISTVELVGNQIHGIEAGNKLNIMNYIIEDGDYKTRMALHVYCRRLPESLSLDKHELNLEYGDKFELTHSFYPEDTYYKGVTYEISDPKILKRDRQGKFNVVGNGQAVVTVRSTYDDKLYDQCVVNVYTKVAGISLTPSTNYEYSPIDVGETITLKATIRPSEAVNKEFTLESSNPSVATIDKDGNVKGISPGKTTITARSVEGNFTATKTVAVAYRVKGIDVPKKKITLYSGSTYQVSNLNIKTIPEKCN